MMLKTKVIAAISILMLTACSATKQNPTPFNFDNPPQNMASIYMFQENDEGIDVALKALSFGVLDKIDGLAIRGLKITHLDKGKTVQVRNRLNTKNYLVVNTTPGTVKISMTQADQKWDKEIKVEANKNYYLSWTGHTANYGGDKFFVTKTTERNAKEQLVNRRKEQIADL